MLRVQKEGAQICIWKENPSKSTVREPPSMLHQKCPYGGRCSVSKADGLYIHLYLSESPKAGKHIVTVHGAPRGRKAYMYWGAAWFHKGIVYDTAFTTPAPFSLQHDTFHLDVGRPELRWPACVVVTLNSPHLLPSSSWPRVESTNPRNPEIRTRGWICGRQIEAWQGALHLRYCKPPN